MGKSMVSLRLDDELLEWATGYAEQRGVPRSELLAAAVASFKEDAEQGVPEIRELMRRQRREAQPGECVCPVFEDGRRGFRQRCPVHGFGDAPVEVRRAHFARATAERSELFGKLRAPESTRRWGSEKKP